MARGLFAVYRDDTAAAAPSQACSTARGASTNKLAVRRQDGSFARDIAGRGLGLREKENIDPFAPGPVGKSALGKGNGLSKLAKSSDGLPSCAPTLRKGLSASSNAAKPTTSARAVTTASANGICTGTLRTRVLPDLPPLPVEAPIVEPSSARTAPAAANGIKPSVVEVRLPPSSAESSPRSSCDRSYTSATDSGYAQSPRGPSISSADASRSEIESSIAVAFADEADSSDMSLVGEEQMDVTDSDRRARALTESPLAEVTQAFTGLGGFSIANMSPSPAPPSALFAQSPATNLSRPSSLRHPASPTPTTLSLGPVTSLKGPASVATKRLTPSQTNPSAPKAAPGRSMRL
ncbi:hypothetical protein JCM10908_004619 [Rhodotorula pacifica]|uniref:uncharacterized protein n=1 Tax=Rhodotorula pacifica TaxID=1495444 RepID=UPI00316CF81A